MTAPTTQNAHKIVIIGGGITGLSTAWYLQKQANEQQVSVHITILEKSSRFGGKIRTEQIDDTSEQPFIIETGPDSFLTQKPWALQLARELGMEDRFLGTNDHKRNIYVLHRGKPVLMPAGVRMMIPTKFWPFITTPLISWPGKLRMAMDYFIPAKEDDEDESLASFIRRRFGEEALHKLAEPMMAGIYSSDADKQSIMATFARFRTLEKKHGSLIRAMLNAPKPPKSTISTFMSFRDGVQELVDELTAQLTCEMQADTGVTSIEKIGQNQYHVITDDQQVFDADTVVITTPAPITAKLLNKHAPKSAELLKTIRYVSTGTISLAYHREDIKQPLDGFGLIIPLTEKRPINAITVSSTKFDHRAPEDIVLLRVFFGGARSPKSMQLDDDAIKAMVQSELKSIMNISAEPLFSRIYRWWNANPQYDVDHLQCVDKIEAGLPDALFLAGCAYRGVGIPDCVHQGQQAAEKVITQLTERARIQ